MPATEAHDKLYAVALDVQKQIGVVSAETARQSQMLIDLNAKVAIANGRTAKNEGSIEMLKEWRKYILGGIAIISLIGMFTLTAYIQKVSREAVKDALATYSE